MVAASAPLSFDASRPLDLASQAFHDHKYEWYRWMLEEAPVCPGKISLMKITLVSRDEDCRMVLAGEKFMRNRGGALGKPSASPFPIPLPSSIRALTVSMIVQDDPEHRRLRNLVNKGFTARAVARLSSMVEEIADERLEALARADGPVDLLSEYARPIPMRVIASMVGVSQEEVKGFDRLMTVLSKGLTGAGIVRTLLWDLRKAQKWVRDLVTNKRARPGDDILSELMEAEDEGDRLTEDELVAMVFLLIIAGFETTLHSITNGARTLFEHADQLGRLGADPGLWPTAADEIIRYRGPVHGTKLQYAAEDMTLHGVDIKRGTAVMPMLAAANRDPRAFEKPDEFDVGRTPNHHLGFGFGAHFCLGRQLALMETETALHRLFDRYPNLHLAVDPSELKIVKMPGWHRHEALPVILA
ncbi:MAG: cytochrome P450 [Myxococcota bacterium]|nr:cytochrome P450 [Myxococcota bacterium]